MAEWKHVHYLGAIGKEVVEKAEAEAKLAAADKLLMEHQALFDEKYKGLQVELEAARKTYAQNEAAIYKSEEARIASLEKQLAAAEAAGPWLAALKCRDNHIASLEAEVEGLRNRGNQYYMLHREAEAEVERLKAGFEAAHYALSHGMIANTKEIIVSLCQPPPAHVAYAAEPARPVVKRGRKYCESCSWFGDCADGNKSRYACLDYVERQPAPPARGFGLEEALKKRRRKA